MIVGVCSRMLWTYGEFLEQPEWFIEELIRKFEQEDRDLKRSLGKK